MLAQPQGVLRSRFEDDSRLYDAGPSLAQALDHGTDGDELAAAVDHLHPVSLFTREARDQHGLTVLDSTLFSFGEF